LKDLQAVILAAVLLSPVALGAGELGVVPLPAHARRNAGKILSFNASAVGSVSSKPEGLGLAEASTLSVWNMNKAARQLLILRLESLKWP
jgi:hypothetical protein